MTSKITRLRSELQHISNELQSLTDTDLTECKWPIRKRIIEELFRLCPRLAENVVEMDAMIEKREEEIFRLRKVNAEREKKLEYERAFRTDFMRFALRGLEDLKWPPTMEAFSDPFDSFFNDQAFFIDAVSHIVDVGIPMDPRRRSRSPVPVQNVDIIEIPTPVATPSIKAKVSPIDAGNQAMKRVNNEVEMPNIDISTRPQESSLSDGVPMNATALQRSLEVLF